MFHAFRLVRMALRVLKKEMPNNPHIRALWKQRDRLRVFRMLSRFLGR